MTTPAPALSEYDQLVSDHDAGVAAWNALTPEQRSENHRKAALMGQADDRPAPAPLLTDSEVVAAENEIATLRRDVSARIIRSLETRRESDRELAVKLDEANRVIAEQKQRIHSLECDLGNAVCALRPWGVENPAMGR